MNPKSFKEAFDPTAKELDIDPQIVKDVVGFFYSEVRKSLSDMVNPNIEILGLGNFIVKPAKLRSLYMKYNKYLEVTENAETFSQVVARERAKERLEIVKSVQRKIWAERIRKQEYILNREKYYENSESNKK